MIIADYLSEKGVRPPGLTWQMDNELRWSASWSGDSRCLLSCFCNCTLYPPAHKAPSRQRVARPARRTPAIFQSLIPLDEMNGSRSIALWIFSRLLPARRSLTSEQGLGGSRSVQPGVWVKPEPYMLLTSIPRPFATLS